VVYRTGLENRRRGNPAVGSNPTSSANFHISSFVLDLAG
jgi:hypothetical protein